MRTKKNKKFARIEDCLITYWFSSFAIDKAMIFLITTFIQNLLLALKEPRAQPCTQGAASGFFFLIRVSTHARHDNKIFKLR